MMKNNTKIQLSCSDVFVPIDCPMRCVWTVLPRRVKNFSARNNNSAKVLAITVKLINLLRRHIMEMKSIFELLLEVSSFY